MVTLTDKEITRFWNRVDRRGPDECWPWKAGVDWDGYGLFCFGYRTGQKTRGAHRVAYLLVNGIIPEGLHVLHRCDNPPCCNPNHLYAGTRLQNAADMVARERTCSSLTWDQVRRIREQLQSGALQYALAVEYGVSNMAISRIARHVSWKERLPTEVGH